SDHYDVSGERRAPPNNASFLPERRNCKAHSASTALHSTPCHDRSLFAPRRAAPLPSFLHWSPTRGSAPARPERENKWPVPLQRAPRPHRLALASSHHNGVKSCRPLAV